MRTWLPIVLLASCVPASEKPPPAGAAGFVTDPSPTSRGEPFVTTDGWTVTIDELALSMNVSAYATTLSDFGGGSDTWLVSTKEPATVFARKCPIGYVTMTVSIYGQYLSDHPQNVDAVGIDDDVLRRFESPADLADDETYPHGPSVVLVAHGEKDGRTVTVDIALSSNGVSLPSTIPQIEVHEDALTTIPFGIYGERLFQNGSAGGPAFGDFAIADADGDGHVTPAELRTATVQCTVCGYDGPQPGAQSLFVALVGRTSFLFTP